MDDRHDPRVDDLIGVYLAHLRGEGPTPDIRDLDPDERARALEVFQLLDALTDMGRELPALEDDPVAQRLALERSVVDVADDQVAPSPVTVATRTSRRRTGLRISRPLWAIAAAMTLVVAVTSSLVVLDGDTAAAVEVGELTADCRTTFGGPGARLPGSRPHVVVAATWAGKEQERFKAVLDRFAHRTGIDVSFATHNPTADRDLGHTLDRLEEGGCAPDVALLPQPGLMADLAADGRLTPLDDSTRAEVSRRYSRAWQELGEVKGTPYGVWFKAANKSTVWYNAHAFDRAGIAEPPSDWKGFVEAAEKLLAVRIPPFAVAGDEDDAWVLTDWFENVYLRSAGPAKYDQLVGGELEWTDQTVKDALEKLAEIFGGGAWLAGGTAGSLELTYEGSVRKVFENPHAPEAGMVFEGDFVATVVETTNSTIGVDARFFPFPSIEGYEHTVVGTGGPSAPGEAGGDVAVMMTDTDPGRQLLRFLASPDAAEPWVKKGGFISPNRGVDLDEYPDKVVRQAARELVEAESLRFDLSDQLDAEFGSTPGQGMWKVLREFLNDPSDVDGTAQRLEEAAKVFR